MADINFARDEHVIRINDAMEMPPSRSNAGIGVELLFNRSKVSPEVMSMCGSEEDDDAELPPDDADLGSRGRGGGYVDNDEDDGYGPPPPHRQFVPQQASSYQSDEEVKREKREIMWQFDNMAVKGIKVPSFSMSDGLAEMKEAMARVVHEREQEASVRFQRKAVMACVSGIEFLNSRFNPADVHLDGWSETVNDSLTIGDYDDIFGELAEKYKMSGKKFAPELRLMFSIGGSALMFHLSHTMLKNSAIPGIDAVLKSNPQLMRQVASAAAKMGGSIGRGGGSGGGSGGGGGGFDLGSMFNMFGGGGGGGGNNNNSRPPPPPMPPMPPMPPPHMQPPPMPHQMQQQMPQQMPQQATMRGPQDMDELMRHLHADPGAERFEVMSVTDSDISSILDTTVDGAARRRSRSSGKAKRTLNL